MYIQLDPSCQCYCQEPQEITKPFGTLLLHLCKRCGKNRGRFHDSMEFVRKTADGLEVWKA